MEIIDGKDVLTIQKSENGRKYSKKRKKRNHDSSERRKVFEPVEKNFYVVTLDELEKAAPPREGLVAQKKQIKGKQKTYQAVRWTRPGEKPKEGEEKKLEGEGEVKGKGAQVGHVILVGKEPVKVIAVGKDGVTVTDEKGDKHLIRHENVEAKGEGKEVAEKHEGKEVPKEEKGGDKVAKLQSKYEELKKLGVGSKVLEDIKSVIDQWKGEGKKETPKKVEKKEKKETPKKDEKKEVEKEEDKEGKPSKEKIDNAIDSFANEIAKKPKNKQEKWADSVGYKKYANIFDKLSDKEHNDAMDQVWAVVKEH
jgi:hypothetical protein